MRQFLRMEMFFSVTSNWQEFYYYFFYHQTPKFWYTVQWMRRLWINVKDKMRHFSWIQEIQRWWHLPHYFAGFTHPTWRHSVPFQCLALVRLNITNNFRTGHPTPVSYMDILGDQRLIIFQVSLQHIVQISKLIIQRFEAASPYFPIHFRLYKASIFHLCTINKVFPTACPCIHPPIVKLCYSSSLNIP